MYNRWMKRGVFGWIFLFIDYILSRDQYPTAISPLFSFSVCLHLPFLLLSILSCAIKLILEWKSSQKKKYHPKNTELILTV